MDRFKGEEETLTEVGWGDKKGRGKVRRECRRTNRGSEEREGKEEERMTLNKVARKQMAVGAEE